MPHIIHDLVTQPTYSRAIRYSGKQKKLKESNMLTEVDIQRIMAAKRQLTESVADATDYELIDDIEVFEMEDEDTPNSEINGLM